MDQVGLIVNFGWVQNGINYPHLLISIAALFRKINLAPMTTFNLRFIFYKKHRTLYSEPVVNYRSVITWYNLFLFLFINQIKYMKRLDNMTVSLTTL